MSHLNAGAWIETGFYVNGTPLKAGRIILKIFNKF